MKRRDFIIANLKLGAGTLIFPSLLGSCAKDSFFDELNYDGKVIIIGAGVAGLYAGYLLKEKGIDFTILEASGRAGGRIGKHSGFADFDIDTGAQWMHGDFSIVGDLVKTTNTPTFRDNSDTQFWYKGKIQTVLPAALDQFQKKLEESSDDVSFEQFFYNSGGTDDEYPLLNSLTADVGASPQNISVKWENAGYEFISYGSDEHKFEKTYFDLINDELISKVASNIQFNTVVSDINYASDKVIVTDAGGTKHSADKVIITVPITVLKEGDITFSPGLPKAKTTSFQQLGMEAGMKAFMRFSDPFTKANINGGDVCASYVYESYQRSSGDLVLFGFAMGDQAKALSEMGEAAALQAMLDELDTMFDGAASASYVDHYFQDWYKEPFIRGAYSYPLVGAGEDTRKNLAQPVDDKLFFAGEATNFNGHHQTVHGAIESGYREVINLLDSVS